MRVQRFNMLISGQMFMVPKGGPGSDCLWVKQDTESARSFPAKWGTCHFRGDDEVLEVDTERAAKLIIADQR